MSTRLTKLEVEAVLDVLNECMAGGTEDLRDALGIPTMKEAERTMERLERAADKLGAKKFPKKVSERAPSSV